MFGVSREYLGGEAGEKNGARKSEALLFSLVIRGFVARMALARETQIVEPARRLTKKLLL